MSGSHDGIYRRLFSNPQLIVDLVRYALGADALSARQIETLESMPAHYVSDELQQREDDVVWRLRRSGEADDWFYVYVLVEFQSTNDRFMALRVMTYVGLLYEDIVRRDEVDARRQLPPILPVVFYNGDSPWSAPEELSRLIRKDEQLAAYEPRFRYLLVDEARQPLDALPAESLLHAVVQLEQARTADELLDAVRAARGISERLDDADLERDFEIWLRRVLVPLRFPELEGRTIKGLREMETRLERTVRGWTEEWLAQGRSEGIAQGRSEGVAQGRSEGLATGQRRGKVQSLLQLLTLKFGTIPASTRRRIEAADSSTLESWTGRVLTAESVDDIVC